MQPVVTAEQMRALDRATISLGLPAFTLMETAGRGVAYAALELLDTPASAHVAVVCGPGNNGGDGFVAARVLGDHGVNVSVYLVVPREKIAGDALDHLELFERCGGIAIPLDDAGELPTHEARIVTASIVIDAVFGIGTVRPVIGHLANVIAAINRAPLRIAVDIPSGLDADTGTVPDGGAVVNATHTVSMAVHKIAHVSAPGFAHCGEVALVDIGIPLRTAGFGRPELVDIINSIGGALLEESDIVAWLPDAGPLDHKGTRGHTVVISGAPEMRGAGRLAANAAASALAALRAGSGLVTLAGDRGITASDDSVMTREIEGSQLHDLLDGKAAVVIGPGLGMGDVAIARVMEVLALGVPAVLDADALNILANDPSIVLKANAPVVITPHPGEAGRLLGISTQHVEADRMSAVRALAEKTRAVVVLKGARTLICDGSDPLHPSRVFINPTGSPALATGGSGDVLAGLIAGLLAQKLRSKTSALRPPVRAACCAAFIHGRAGELLEARHGRGAVSSDLPRVIADVLGALTA